MYETLIYSAKLRLCSSIPLALKKEKVETIISEFGLESCRNTRVEGISGGERKRLSIGIELVTGTLSAHNL